MLLNDVAFTGVLLMDLATGKWPGAAEVPQGNLEEAEKQLEGEEKKLLLDFVKWKPEERSSAKDLLDDDIWLNSV